MKSKNLLWTQVWSWFSLALLLLFLGFWLKQIYQDKRDQLRGELGLLMDRLENAQIDAFVQVLTFKASESDSLKGYGNIVLKTDEDIGLDITERSLWAQQAHNRFPEFISKQRDTMLIIESRFDTTFKEDLFPRFGLRNDSMSIRFKVLLDTTEWQNRSLKPVLVDLRKDTFPQGPSSLLSRDEVSHVVFGGPRYAVGLNGYQSLVLQNMAPEIGVAVLLFGSLWLSFYLIRRNQKKQAQLLALKNDFIANISHELNTPITTVSVALEALELNPEKKRSYLDIARKELGRLSLLVDRVLHLSQHEEGQIRLQQEEVDISQLIEELLTVLTLRLEKENAQIQFEKEGQNFLMNIDPLHLSNVLHNLIDNAIKYSEEPADISIRLSEQGHQYLLEISDKGIGISPEAQERLFEKFYRAPDPRGHVVKGYGLGLSYVAQVIKSMKGQIKVESQLGQGSRFSIHLPKSNL